MDIRQRAFAMFAPFVRREATKAGDRLELFEGRGGEGRAALGPPAAEGDPQLAQPEVGGQGGAAIDGTTGGGRQRAPAGQPAAVAQQRGNVVDREGPRVDAAQQGRRVRVGAVEDDAGVLEHGCAGTAPELVSPPGRHF